MTAADLAWLTPHTAAENDLPRPTTERWQPLRLGLVDMFYYDDEQFWFQDGRLLLRGNNGTGKSKVLALTLPFLLDGSVLPRRVEPDADPKKRMEWNLLLGGAHGNPERTGYSWVEFGRVDADGTTQFTTLGIGLKAASGRGIVKQWYFTSTRRIGDLRLMDSSRTVLSDVRLRDELGSAGAVYTTQEAYRRAVDEALFRLGDRYDALIDLLIQLRQPQLSKRPDEKALSAALTEALAPLDQAIIADVAESFRSLEDEREGITAAKDTLRSAQAFLRDYRVYARIAARRRSTALRVANSEFEWAGRNLRETEDQLAAATDRVAELEQAEERNEKTQSGLRGQEQALRESPEMKDADRLHEAGQKAEELDRRADKAATDAAAAGERAAEALAQQQQAAERVETLTARTEHQDQTARGLARTAGLDAEHERVATDAAATSRSLTRRREQIESVRRFADLAAQATARADERRRALDGADAATARRAEEAQSAADEVEVGIEELRGRIRGYVAGLSALELSGGAEELAESAAHWSRSLEGPSPVADLVRKAASTALAAAERDRAAATHESDRLTDEIEGVRRRAAELDAGENPEPPPVPGRDLGERMRRAGAPLWRVADFADGAEASERAGIEAALQSAGLLDAWILPDGSLAADGDVVLGATDGIVGDGASLADVLVPAIGPEDRQVRAEIVAGVLARIGLGEASGAALWVDTSGGWGAGPARGSWTKTSAEYVGAGAREATRRRLLADLAEQERLLGEQLAGVHARVNTAVEKTAAVRSEQNGYPEDAEANVRTLHERSASAKRELDRARTVSAEAGQEWDRAQALAAGAAEELAEAAADLGTGRSRDDLDRALRALTDYEVALVELRSAAAAGADAARDRDRATHWAEQTARLRAEAGVEARDLRADAAGARSRFEALQESVGASVADLQARLGETMAALRAAEEAAKKVAKDQRAAAAEEGRLDEKVIDLRTRREERAAHRDEQVAALRLFTATGLLRVALPELPAPEAEADEEWNVTGAVGFARTAEQHLADADESDDSWNRSQDRVTRASNELTTQMSRHGHQAYLDQRGEMRVAKVRYLNEDLDIDLLEQRLAGDVADRERLLSAREREILENHLVNEVAGHLHDLLQTAERQIHDLNAELGQRKTSTGMQLRVRWRERNDGPAGLADARALMTRSDATWTADDRRAIGDFLQAQIEAVRQADPTAGWSEHLEKALDYRQWHTFVVERHQNGAWRSASGPASGGEKVLAVSVPLFAAASAHYNSAGSPHAPRLILLDEAFAGVDDDSRAKSLGLLATFDLDVVMTSEREWACYPSVPGIAIAQLSRVEGIDAVGVTRWRWDGRRRSRLGEVGESAKAGRPDEAGPPPDRSLFG